MRPPLAAELFRLLHTRSTGWMLLLPAVGGALRIVLGRSVAQVEQARLAASGGVAPGLDATGFGPLADGLRTGSTVLTLVLLVAGALSLVREREHGALGLMFLARGRLAVVSAKAFALIGLVIAGFALLFATCVALAGWLYGLGPIVVEGYELATAADLWREIGRGCLPALPGLITAPLFGLFISSVATTSGAAVACTLVPVVLIDVIQGFAERLARYLFVTYAPLLGDGSPLAVLPEMARAYSDAMWEPDQVRLAVTVPSLWAVALVAATAWVTRSRPA